MSGPLSELCVDVEVEAHLAQALRLPFELLTNGLSDDVAEWRRDGVSDLELDGSAVAGDLEVFGKALEPLQLRDSKAAAIPVEGADIRTGLPLDGR